METGYLRQDFYNMYLLTGSKGDTIIIRIILWNLIRFIVLRDLIGFISIFSPSYIRLSHHINYRLCVVIQDW